MALQPVNKQSLSEKEPGQSCVGEGPPEIQVPICVGHFRFCPLKKRLPSFSHATPQSKQEQNLSPSWASSPLPAGSEGPLLPAEILKVVRHVERCAQRGPDTRSLASRGSATGTSDTMGPSSQGRAFYLRAGN